MVLMMLIDIIDQYRRFQDVDVTFGQLFRLVLLNTPAALSSILPLLMILSTVAMFVVLARSSELVVTRSAGRSGIRALLAPTIVSLVIGGLAVGTLNPIVAATSNRYDQLEQSYRSGGPSAVSLSSEGLWLRQGSAQGQSVIHATGYEGQSNTLYDVTFISFAPYAGPVRRIYAESAQLVEGEWILQNAKAWPLTPGLNPESSSAEHDELRLATTLTPNRIRETLISTDGLSVWQMPQIIRQLGDAGFATTRHRVLFHAELARPVFLVAMMLVAAAYTMRHARFGGTGIAVLTAVLIGFGLYFLRNFAQILGENGQIPPALAAWAIPVSAIMLSLGLLLQAEDG